MSNVRGCLIGLALVAGGSSAFAASRSRERTDGARSAPLSGDARTAAPAAPVPPARQSWCLDELKAAGARYSSASSAPGDAVPCLIVDPVILESAAMEGGDGRVDFSDRPRLACAMALRLTRFTAGPLKDIARRQFGKELVSVATGPGYECRPRNRQAGAKISAHGAGLAVDISSLGFARRDAMVVVQGPAAFLLEVEKTACEWFNTVLGPGSDVFHRDHLHIDLEPRGKSGDVKYCR